MISGVFSKQNARDAVQPACSVSKPHDGCLAGPFTFDDLASNIGLQLHRISIIIPCGREGHTMPCVRNLIQAAAITSVQGRISDASLIGQTLAWTWSFSPGTALGYAIDVFSLIGLGKVECEMRPDREIRRQQRRISAG